MELEYSGDFANFECPSCYKKTRVVIKHGEQPTYFCAYCGKSWAVTEPKPKWRKARKKPVIVEWREVEGEREEIATLENRGGEKLIANAGVDVIIKGVKGELYPCRKDIFDATYEVL